MPIGRGSTPLGRDADLHLVRLSYQWAGLSESRRIAEQRLAVRRSGENGGLAVW